VSVDRLLAKLDRVRRTGDARWAARCPAHEDRSPSLSIREIDDGRILLHCFGGCSVEDVVGAIGVRLEDLFPPRPMEHARRVRKPWSDRNLLEVLDRETIVVFIAACDLAIERRALSYGDVNRLRKARERIAAVAEALSS
jgi:hypothetical protein